MSTILKALKRLEHEKEAETLRDRAHDPLAPAASQPSARLASKRPPAWLAAAVAAALVGAGASYAMASWWFARDAQTSPSDVAAGRAPLASIPSENRRPTPNDAARRAPPPLVGVEVAAPARSSLGVNAGDGVSRVEFAQVTPADPDPWEQAAAAARAEDEEADAAAAYAGSRPPVAARPPTVAPTLQGVAPRPENDSASRIAKSSTMPSRRPDPEPFPSMQGAIPVASLPVIDLPEPRVEPEPAVERRGEAVQAAPKTQRPPVARSETKPSAPREGLGPVTVQVSEDRIEVVVMRTIWHPKPERRSAQIRLADRLDPIQVREEDVIEGYVVQEITPSSVVLARGKVVVTHRVGR